MDVTTIRSGIIWLMSREPDENLKFSVLIDGYREDWTLDKIKEEIAAGATLRE